LIDTSLFRVPVVRDAFIVYGLASFVCVGSFVLVSQYMQLVISLSPLQAGLWTLPMPLIFVIGSIVTPVVARRYGRGNVMVAGLLIAGIGFLAQSVLELKDAISIALVFATYAAGLSPLFPLSIDAVMAGAPAKQAGAVSALSETVGEFGAALGIALLGSLGSAVYRLNLQHVTSDAQARGIDISTLGSAVQSARQADAPFGAQLLEVSRSAFTVGLQVASVVAALLLVIAALWVARSHAAERRLASNHVRR
jgi:MFS transporter, DHA2 family, multidrug resistance protein